MNTWHWTASRLLNALLLGDPSMPLCARVWRSKPSAARTAYLKAMDVVFMERDHCLYITLRWLDERLKAMGVRA